MAAPCPAASAGAARVASGCTTIRTKCAAQFSGDGDLRNKRVVWENSLQATESDALYSVGSVQTPLATFHTWLLEGQLNLFPEYQRAYVWEPDKASRLIVTLLLNRIVLPVVLHEKTKGTYDVVDGKQRLTTMLGFLMCGQTLGLSEDREDAEKLMSAFQDLRYLVKLDESNEQLNGLRFSDLSDSRQRAYKSFKITYILIPYKTPRDDVFGVYRDINSGGEDTNAQQTRRVVFSGDYIKLLDKLALNCTDFHAIRDSESFKRSPPAPEEYKCCKFESDRELILRAFAFRESGDRYKPSLEKFLNRELDGSDDSSIDELSHSSRSKAQQKLSEKLQEREAEFEDVMKVARNVWGFSAFRKWSLQRRSGRFVLSTSINKRVWDVQYTALAELLREFKPVQFTEAKENLVTAVQKCFEGGFQSTTGFSAQKFLAQKDAMKSVLRSAIMDGSTSRDQQRVFSPNLRQPLFEDQRGRCLICNQGIDLSRVEDGSYVHIDHVHAHSHGDPSTLENARLVHAVCNLKKGAS